MRAANLNKLFPGRGSRTTPATQKPSPRGINRNNQLIRQLPNDLNSLNEAAVAKNNKVSSSSNKKRSTMEDEESKANKIRSP